MPIAVRCRCGKTFNVRDEFAGKSVQCQVCKADVEVPLQEVVAIPPAQPVAPSPVDPSGTRVCPFCAERIQEAAILCPLCGESLARSLPEGQVVARIREALESVRNHVDNWDAAADDKELAGFYFKTSTIILGLLSLICLGLIVKGAFMRMDGEPYIIIGVILLLIFGSSWIVAWVRDYGAANIRNAKSAKAAMQRFLISVKTGRTGKAYVALAPSARTSGGTVPLTFEKIHHESSSQSIDGLPGFKRYWKSVFKGPSSYSRSAQISNVYVVNQLSDDVAIVSADIKFSSYLTWLALSILLNILICIILVMALQKREKKTIRKLLVRCEGEWFMVSGELEGPLDVAEPESVWKALGLT